MSDERRRMISVRFDPCLWEEVKQVAALENRTASNLLEVAAREYIERRTADMQRVITFESAELQGHRIDITPRQLAMYRDAGWNVPIIGAAAYGSVHHGEHWGEPTYTDEEVKAFVDALPRRGQERRTSYRAAIYRADTGDEQVMSAPEDAGLTDEELIARAMQEAHDAGLIGPEWPQVPEEEYRARLYIGEWVE